MEVPDAEDVGGEHAGGHAPPSRRDRRRAETRERIFEAAMQLLTEREFDAVTVEMITDAADVGKGTFFNYFNSKEAVVGYHFEQQWTRMTEVVERARTGAEPSLPGEGVAGEVGPVARLMRDIFHFAADEDCRSKQLVRTLLALSLTNARVRAASEEVHTRMKELAQEVVRGGQSSGELRDDISAERLTAMFVAVYLSSLFIWAELDDFSDSIHTILDRQFALLWRGIRSF